MITVYLSGSPHGDWQEEVMEKVPDLKYINPKAHHLVSPAAYTVWDLLGIKLSDVMFAYLSRDNPSGIDLALEVGYAKALGKTVIFVDEGSGIYSEIIRHTVDVWTSGLDTGINLLRKMTLMGG
jgi:hypothetical protein